MPMLSLPWADGSMDIELPESWQLKMVASPKLIPSAEDWPERVAISLSQPSAGRPLSKLIEARRDGKIAIVVEDATRHSPVAKILEILLREISHCRISDDQIEIIFATGMHHDVTAAQAREKLGPFADRLKWRSNPWTDPSAYVRVGSAGKIDLMLDRGLVEADLRILISSVSPHLQAGFGGGYKMVLPGCASLETIRGLHRLGLGRKARQLVGTEGLANPMRRTIDECGRLLDTFHGHSFALSYLLDNDSLPSCVAGGDVLPIQRMIAKQCAVACGVVLEEPADIVITNAYPRDYDLWQSFKGIANTQWAAKPDGVIICLTHCPAGMNGMKPPRWPVSPKWTRRILRFLGPETVSSILTRVVPTLAGDAAFFVRLGMQTLRRNPIIFVSETLAEMGSFPGLTICRTMAEAVKQANEMLDEPNPRVIAFPMGGATYPIPRLMGFRGGQLK